MRLTLTQIIFKDTEDKRYNLKKAYSVVEGHFKGSSITYIDKGLVVEYIVNKRLYNYELCLEQAYNV